MNLCAENKMRRTAAFPSFAEDSYECKRQSVSFARPFPVHGIFLDWITITLRSDTRYRVITLDCCIVDNDGLTMNNNTYSFNCDKFLSKLIAVFGTDTECTRVSPHRRLKVIVKTIHCYTIQ